MASNTGQSVYIKTEDGVDFIYEANKIQNAKVIKCGSKTVKAGSTGSTGIVLFEPSELQSITGSSSSRYVILVCRDFRESWSNLQTATNVNGTYYVVLSSNAGNTNNIHINYMIVEI